MKKNILIVENEVIIADDLAMLLKKLGYAPLEPALTYKEAIQLLANEKIDLVILDINLNTRKTGIDLARFIRENYDLPFIFLTSYTDPKTLELAKPTLPYAYLVKPYEARDLMMSIEIAINNHKSFSAKGESTENNLPDFTSTELAVLKKIAESKTTRQIASELFVSESTVKNHRHNVSQKLNLPATTNSLLTWVLGNSHLL